MAEFSISQSQRRSPNSSYNSSSPRKRRTLHLKFPPEFTILESPNLRATVEKSLYRIPDGSEALSPNSRELESKWNDRFNVLFSKDNHKVYRQVREYFDSPRKFDEGIKKSNNRSPRFKNRRQKRLHSGPDNREFMWDTRYTFSSECNQTKHKNMRAYFDQPEKLPKINN